MFQTKLSLNMVVSDALEALNFYEHVFDVTRGEIYEFPDVQRNNEVNIVIADMGLRLIDENKEFDCLPPKANETDSIWLQIIVDDVDNTLAKAKEQGAKVLQEVNEFMGVKNAIIGDPFGYTWTINQIIKEITFEERYEIYKQYQAEMKEE